MDYLGVGYGINEGGHVRGDCRFVSANEGGSIGVVGHLLSILRLFNLLINSSNDLSAMPSRGFLGLVLVG